MWYSPKSVSKKKFWECNLLHKNSVQTKTNAFTTLFFNSIEHISIFLQIYIFFSNLHTLPLYFCIFTHSTVSNFPQRHYILLIFSHIIKAFIFQINNRKFAGHSTLRSIFAKNCAVWQRFFFSLQQFVIVGKKLSRCCRNRRTVFVCRWWDKADSRCFASNKWSR